MIDENESRCACDNCTGSDCTCGCQEPRAEAACACGPTCACGVDCNCANCDGDSK